MNADGGQGSVLCLARIPAAKASPCSPGTFHHPPHTASPAASHKERKYTYAANMAPTLRLLLSLKILEQQCSIF